MQWSMAPATFVQLLLAWCARLSTRAWLQAAPAQLEQRGPASSMPATSVQLKLVLWGLVQRSRVPAIFVQSELLLWCCVQRSFVQWLPAEPAQLEQRGPASLMSATFVQSKVALGRFVRSSVVPATLVQSELVLWGLVLWEVVLETFVESESFRLRSVQWSLVPATFVLTIVAGPKTKCVCHG